MQHKKNLVITVLFFVLVLVCVLLIRRKNSNSIQVQQKWNKEVNDSKNLNAIQTSFSMHQFRLMKEFDWDAITLVRDSMPQITNHDSQKVRLAIMIPSSTCDACVYDVVSKLKGRDILVKDSIWIFTETDNLKDLRILAENIGFGVRIFGFQRKRKIEAFDLQKPIVFIIEAGNKVSNVFIPIIELPDRTNQYLQLTQDIFYL